MPASPPQQATGMYLIRACFHSPSILTATATGTFSDALAL